MPINTQHPHYEQASLFWARCRHLIAGEDQVKKHAEKMGYLPKLEGMEQTDYAAYLARSMFYNGMGRTVEAVAGSIFRKPTVIEPEPSFDGEDLFRTIDRKCREAVTELLSVGRAGILTDVKPDGGLPYYVVYAAEQIINWRFTMDGDDEKLEMVVLVEHSLEPSPKDEYESIEVTRYRELKLVEGVYTQQLWIETKDDRGKVTVIEDGPPVTPLAVGQAMDEIPFVFVAPTSCSVYVDDPPLLDLANVNLSHFRTSADLEHGRHFTALPTAWVAGFAKDEPLRIGSGTAWVTDNVSARAGYLEFTGAGLRALETAMESKEHLMAVLGARLFEPQKVGVEAAETIRLRQSADTATASTIADVCSDAFTRSYRWFLGFIRAADKSNASIKINNDVLDATIDPAQVAALLTMWEKGAISFQTLLFNLKKGEIIPPDTSIEDEEEQIKLDDAKFAKGEFRFKPPPEDDGPPKPKAKS